MTIETNTIPREQIFWLIPREQRGGKYQCPRCNKWHLEIGDGPTPDFNCWSPECKGKASEIAALIWAEVRKREGKPLALPEASENDTLQPLTAADYCREKCLPWNLLGQDSPLGRFAAKEGESPFGAVHGVCFPYFDEHGKEVTALWRFANGQKRYLKGHPTYLYGGRMLQWLEAAAGTPDGRDEIILCEGVSNVHTLATVNLPALGVPGARNFKPEWAKLKCLDYAKRIYILLDMRPDGKPEDVAIVGAHKIAELFPPGKVLAVKLPMKDVSELWKFHHDEMLGGEGERGFLQEWRDAIVRAVPIIPERECEEGLPDDLGPEVLEACPLLKDFVERVRPVVEADDNMLICDFLAYAGVALGLRGFGTVAADKHYPATYWLLIAPSGHAKGTAANVTGKLFSAALGPAWWKIVHTSARSTQSVIRMVKEAAEAEIPTYDRKGKQNGSEPNSEYTEGRVLLRLSEITLLFQGMRAEWSTMSQTLREAYDGGPLSNERAQKEDSIRVTAQYIFGILGDVTRWELGMTIENVDFTNGVANRFIWCTGRARQRFARPPRLPDMSDLADRLKKLVTGSSVTALTVSGQLPFHSTEVDFGEVAGLAWEAWVHSLPLEEEGKLGSACARMRANAFKLCILFALLDERRNAVQIEECHVRAAAAIMDRHRATVKWWLERPVSLPDVGPKEKAMDSVEKVREAVARNGGQLTGTQLRNLFWHMSEEDRAAIATAAGLKCTGDGTKGKPKIWR